MASKLAITDKRPTKRGGLGSVFFQFFDWNRVLSKKKKKLYSNNGKLLLLPSASTKFGEDEKMPKSKHLQVDDGNLECFQNSRKHSDLDIQMRDPGPVAKLMGLESMPIVHNKKPNKPSLVPEFSSKRYETYEAKESRPQKVQRTSIASSSLTLQSSRKVRRQHNHKLASPVRSPRLSSKRRTTRLMEVATKILEPRSQLRRTSVKCALTYVDASQSNESKWRDGIFVKKCNIHLNETVELNLKDEQMNKMKSLESRALPLSSRAKEDVKRSSVVPNGKNKPTLHGIQAKINLEKTTRALRDRENYMQDDHNRNGKGKLIYGSKALDRPFRTRNLDASHSRMQTKELGRQKVQVEMNRFSMKNKGTETRPNDNLLDRNAKVVTLSFEKEPCARRGLINGKEKVAANNISISYSDADVSERNDIVSFTFSSPMRHSSPTTHAFRLSSNKNSAEKKKCIVKPNCNASRPKRLILDGKVGNVASKTEVLLNGDKLSSLLDQKIEELNALIREDCTTTEDKGSTASILDELISELSLGQQDTSCSEYTDISSQTMSHDEMAETREKLQLEAEDGDHQGPVSILEVSFSNESRVPGSPHDCSGQMPDFQNLQPLDLDVDLIDSASSFHTEKFDKKTISHSLWKNSEDKDLLVESICMTDEKDPFFRDTLQALTKSFGVVTTGENQLKRLILDSIMECFNSRYCSIFKSSGSKILSLTRRERLESEVRTEIEEWKSLVGKELNDIIEKDIKRSYAMWTTEFEGDECEVGVQIEREILHELVCEIAIDLCT